MGDNLYGGHRRLIRTAHTYSAFPNCSKIMAGAVQLIFHIVATSNFAFGIYYDCWVLEMPEHYVKSTNPFAGRWKYLTFWNMVLQLVYFSHCLLNDFYGTSSLVKRERAYLQKLRDYLFGALAFPLALFVSITFWGLWAVDREIIFPSALDAFFPSWLNHILHSSIAVCNLGNVSRTEDVPFSRIRTGWSSHTHARLSYLGIFHCIPYQFLGLSSSCSSGLESPSNVYRFSHGFLFHPIFQR